MLARAAWITHNSSHALGKKVDGQPDRLSEQFRVQGSNANAQRSEGRELTDAVFRVNVDANIPGIDEDIFRRFLQNKSENPRRIASQAFDDASVAAMMLLQVEASTHDPFSRVGHQFLSSVLGGRGTVYYHVDSDRYFIGLGFRKHGVLMCKKIKESYVLKCSIHSCYSIVSIISMVMKKHGFHV